MISPHSSCLFLCLLFEVNQDTKRRWKLEYEILNLRGEGLRLTVLPFRRYLLRNRSVTHRMDAAPEPGCLTPWKGGTGASPSQSIVNKCGREVTIKVCDWQEDTGRGIMHSSRLFPYQLIIKSGASLLASEVFFLMLILQYVFFIVSEPVKALFNPHKKKQVINSLKIHLFYKCKLKGDNSFL